MKAISLWNIEDENLDLVKHRVNDCLRYMLTFVSCNFSSPAHLGKPALVLLTIMITQAIIVATS